ncbi:MAG: hypothetical protein M9909_11360 [Thermomicrobiales bacterium]|nr:hypothetical protein [Thermomicrobiales bacterium]
MSASFSICATCGVEHSHPLPDVCAIRADERQYLPADGVQRWTTLDELRDGRAIHFGEIEPRLFAISVTPSVGIGHRPLLVQTDQGNLLWDSPGYIDDDAIQQIRELGGIRWIAGSHPHMFGVQLEWAAAFDALVLVSERDAGWIARQGEAIQLWDDTLELAPGLTLYRLGGHFAGSAVAHWNGADGKGVMLSSDTFASNADKRTVTFLRSYPNRIPLSASTVQRIIAGIAELEFDRLYANFPPSITSDARAKVLHSAERHIGWVSGDFDDLT